MKLTRTNAALLAALLLSSACLTACGGSAALYARQADKVFLTLTDGEGRELLSCAPELPFRVILLSSPELTAGESYTLSVGAETGRVTAK